MPVSELEISGRDDPFLCSNSLTTESMHNWYQSRLVTKGCAPCIDSVVRLLLNMSIQIT